MENETNNKTSKNLNNKIISGRKFLLPRYQKILDEYIDTLEYYSAIYGDHTLPGLVISHTRERYESCLEKLYVAVVDKNNTNLIERTKISMRGLEAMHNQIMFSGLNKKIPIVWTYALNNNTTIGILKNESQLENAKKYYHRLDLLFSLSEVALILNEHQSYVKIKRKLKELTYNQATITKIEEPKGVIYDDEIPF